MELVRPNINQCLKLRVESVLCVINPLEKLGTMWITTTPAVYCGDCFAPTVTSGSWEDTTIHSYYDEPQNIWIGKFPLV